MDYVFAVEPKSGKIYVTDTDPICLPIADPDDLNVLMEYHIGNYGDPMEEDVNCVYSGYIFKSTRGMKLMSADDIMSSDSVEPFVYDVVCDIVNNYPAELKGRKVDEIPLKDLPSPGTVSFKHRSIVYDADMRYLEMYLFNKKKKAYGTISLYRNPMTTWHELSEFVNMFSPVFSMSMMNVDPETGSHTPLPILLNSYDILCHLKDSVPSGEEKDWKIIFIGESPVMADKYYAKHRCSLCGINVIDTYGLIGMTCLGEKLGHTLCANCRHLLDPEDKFDKMVLRYNNPQLRTMVPSKPCCCICGESMQFAISLLGCTDLIPVDSYEYDDTLNICNNCSTVFKNCNKTDDIGLFRNMNFLSTRARFIRITG